MDTDIKCPFIRDYQTSPQITKALFSNLFFLFSSFNAACDRAQGDPSYLADEQRRRPAPLSNPWPESKFGISTLEIRRRDSSMKVKVR